MRLQANYEVIKEPRGFIKVLEIFLAIFAFSCAAGFRGHLAIRQDSKISNVTHTAWTDFSYPFSSISIHVVFAETPQKETYTEYVLDVKEKSSTEFFMVIGVFCFLYALGTLVYYIWFQPDQSTQSSSFRPPVIDFVAGAFWVFFWFASACAQAAAVHRIKDGTDPSAVIRSLPQAICNNVNIFCSPLITPKFATLTVSILLGFLNCFVWAGNMWFLWKETPWHSGSKTQSPSTIPGPLKQPFHQQNAPSAAI